MRRILVVDDSAVIRRVMRKMLEEMRFTVDEAENGELALEAWRRNPPDGVMLDWNMPVMTGIEFLRAMRGEEHDRRTTVVLCTTEHSFAHIEEALEAGADEYIMKPFDAPVLESKLQQVGLL